ncbi:phospholipase D-like domain-containing protein [Streptomyces sp. MAR4 CNX-425]|uniref:phospholipase D-like domain-containing protein n=1 Tax=Streptomyces sp. MAR4 CNX-425 TaxID=3406343 RepID=UPI003B50B2A7
MRRLRAGRPAGVAAVLLALTATLVSGATASEPDPGPGPGPGAAAAEPAAAAKPVINGPVFNDPLGSAARRSAVFTQLIALIDATPAGQTIRSSMFELEDSAVADALIAAHERGVAVKLIVDDNTRDKGSAAWDSLRAALGTNDTKASWIVVCDDQFEDDDGRNDVQRGCAATPPPNPSYNHNKFFVFTKVGPFDDGSSYRKVVFQSSSNLNDWYKNESYNDAVTFADATVHDGYATFHEDQRRLRHSANGDNTYYWSTPTGSTYRAFFFPRGDSDYGNPNTDTIVNALDEVSCSYTGTDGERHQTDIRVAMFQFLGSRDQVARKLAQKRAQNCWVDVVYSEGDAEVEDILDDAGIQRTYCNFNNGPGIDVRTHTKFWLLDGEYNGGITPRVYTGSHNWTGSGLRSADEAMVRITSADYHEKYLSYFYKIRDTCRARTP